MKNKKELFDFLLQKMNIQTISKIKLKKIKSFVQQYIQDLQKYDNLSEEDWIKTIKKYRNEHIKQNN